MGSALRLGIALSAPVEHVCSPRHKGHEDLTSSPPSSGLTPAVFPESPTLLAGNWKQGFRSLWDLTRHLTTRAEDSHAAPVEGSGLDTVAATFPPPYCLPLSNMSSPG